VGVFLWARYLCTTKRIPNTCIDCVYIHTVDFVPQEYRGTRAQVCKALKSIASGNLSFDDKVVRRRMDSPFLEPNIPLNHPRSDAGKLQK
jgi:hypothetical protein